MLGEVDYFLRHHRTAMRALMEDIARGPFTYAPPTWDQLDRAMAIDERYSDLSPGLVDASIVALAETVRVRRIATRDVRAFVAVRLQDGTGLELVVLPTDPER